MFRSLAFVRIDERNPVLGTDIVVDRFRVISGVHERIAMLDFPFRQFLQGDRDLGIMHVCAGHDRRDREPDIVHVEMELVALPVRYFPLAILLAALGEVLL